MTDRHFRLVQLSNPLVNRGGIVIGLSAILWLSACTTIPTGKHKLELIDRLVAEQEFNQIERLLIDINTSDPEFESLAIRRRAIRPLMVQYEQYNIRQAALLQAQDQWPQALALLRGAQQKLPRSEALRTAVNQFFRQRAQRLAQIQRQIGLLEGENHLNKTPLLTKILDIHPAGVGGRWRQFWHRRQSQSLAKDLLECGDHALAVQQLDLAEACFAMAGALSSAVDVSPQLATINRQRLLLEQQAEANAKTEFQQRQQQFQQQSQQQIAALKQQYQHLIAAEWLVAAKQILDQLQILAPESEQGRQWAKDLQWLFDQHIDQGIRRGQALYSHGQLKDALAAWQDTAQLDPENPVLQAHIERAERFLRKLQRLKGGQI